MRGTKSRKGAEDGGDKPEQQPWAALQDVVCHDLKRVHATALRRSDDPFGACTGVTLPQSSLVTRGLSARNLVEDH